jgi:hypothetical protein
MCGCGGLGLGGLMDLGYFIDQLNLFIFVH